MSATVGGVSVTYGYDAQNRRTSRTEAGQTTGYLYGDLAHTDRVTASVAPDGAVTTYTYDDYGHLVSFARGGGRWYVGTDQVGTPRIVLDAGGAVVEQRRADAFGVPQAITGPGAGLPFGFAGGLADPVTGLVRFGTRDYEPASGRFTTPDPILLDSGTPDLYTWMGGDPVSGRDFDGRDGFFSNLFGGIATSQAKGAAVDAAGEVVGKDTAQTADKIKSVVDDVKDGKAPGADDYVENTKAQADAAKENTTSIFDPIKKLWDKCSKALGGDTETGDKNKADPSKPFKRPELKHFNNY